MRSWVAGSLLPASFNNLTWTLSNPHYSHLKSNSGNVTDGVTFTTETGNQDLIVLLNVVQATIIWYECGDFLSVLDELDTNALADSGVGLFGFDTAGRLKENLLELWRIFIDFVLNVGLSMNLQTATHSIILWLESIKPPSSHRLYREQSFAFFS